MTDPTEMKPEAPTPEKPTPENPTPQAQTPQAQIPQAQIPQAQIPQAPIPQAPIPEDPALDERDAGDLTLDEIRLALAPGIATNAAFDGWGDAARDMAAEAAGIDRDIAILAFDRGAVAMIDAWFAQVDTAMATALPAGTLAAMKIRARITALVETRLTAMAPDREALRRALTLLAMPQNLAGAARLGWRTADRIWAAAGDTAVDYNHYTKRAILLAVYASTVTVFLDDDSDGFADTRAFLSRRIDGIMRFEKAKAGFLKRTEHRPSLSRFIGRLRYPAV